MINYLCNLSENGFPFCTELIYYIFSYSKTNEELSTAGLRISMEAPWIFVWIVLKNWKKKKRIGQPLNFVMQDVYTHVFEICYRVEQYFICPQTVNVSFLTKINNKCLIQAWLLPRVMMTIFLKRPLNIMFHTI